ncbi:MAG: imidazole glycerol phosphate synthase subunit HisH [Nitrosomonas sp.]|nr:imidazole glycerol phosphate synthase subunit HisH [Nitrosomonas sp.]
MSTIAIVDYGMGNLRSVSKAVEHVSSGENVVVTSDPAIIRAASRVIVPGQGAMPQCMRALSDHKLREVVLDAAENKPFLGICLGLQMLFEYSEEGNSEALGIFSGYVKKFISQPANANDQKLKIPHMGWNQVRHNIAHPLWENIPEGARFYFVHSYYVVVKAPDIIAANTNYPTPFASAVARNNIFAVQFHPEKSQLAGLRLLSNFLKWMP